MSVLERCPYGKVSVLERCPFGVRIREVSIWRGSTAPSLKVI